MRLLTSNPIFFLRLWDFETWVSVVHQSKFGLMQLQPLRFLPEPEVNVLRNRVNLLNIVSRLFSDWRVNIIRISLHIRGSKVQNPNSNGVIKYSKIVILIYIVIYINIKYIILILNLFQNTIWTFEPLNLLNPAGLFLKVPNIQADFIVFQRLIA